MFVESRLPFAMCLSMGCTSHYYIRSCGVQKLPSPLPLRSISHRYSKRARAISCLRRATSGAKVEHENNATLIGTFSQNPEVNVFVRTLTWCEFHTHRFTWSPRNVQTKSYPFGAQTAHKSATISVPRYGVRSSSHGGNQSRVQWLKTRDKGCP